jgi:hypothetical protein
VQGARKELLVAGYKVQGYRVQEKSCWLQGYRVQEKSCWLLVARLQGARKELLVAGSRYKVTGYHPSLKLRMARRVVKEGGKR